jgi:DNA-binding transcriptional LysR family regulator
MLRYLDEVARCGSIRKAAQRLNIAPSAINRQILALETELDTPIFQRLSRTLRLTAAGELLISHVRQTLKEHKRFQGRIDDLKGMRSGKVTIATMNGLAGGLLPRLVAELCHSHRRIKVSMTTLPVPQIMKVVADGEADLGLAYNIPSDPRLHVVEVFDVRLGAVVAPNHPLARHSPVRLSECASYPLILADDTTTIHRIITMAFARADLVLDPMFQSNSIDFIKCMARAGEGVAFLSAFDTAEDQRNGTLVHLPIQDSYVHQQGLVLVQRAKHTLDAAASLFAEEIGTALRDLVRSRETPRATVPARVASGKVKASSG